MEKIFKVEKKVYKIKNIKQAIKDFTDIALIKYDTKKEELKLSSDNKDDIEEIFNEFMNYIISLECNG